MGRTTDDVSTANASTARGTTAAELCCNWQAGQPPDESLDAPSWSTWAVIAVRA